MQSGHDPTPDGGERTAEPVRPGTSDAFQTGVEHAPVGLGFVNSEFLLTYANQRWRELAGFAGALPASPETMLELVHPDDRHHVAEAFVRCHSEGEEVRQRIRVPGSDDRLHHLMLSLRPVPDGESGYAIGLSDVTEVVAALDEVRRSEERFKS
ncbi:MAG: PAS domain-containing protein, partial [Acidimicrobiales bacterium]